MRNAILPVVILAGGLATRLHPISQSIPKILLPINGEPFINHQLRLLHRHGIRQVVFCIGHLSDVVENHLNNGRRFNMDIRYSYDGETLLGTAGAIKKALPLLSDNFFVVYGDSYLNCNYPAVQSAFFAEEKPALMTVFRNEGLWDNSNVEFDRQHILAYDKQNPTPRMRHIDYGLGVFNKSVFANIAENTPYDLALLYQQLLKNNQLAAHEMTERFYEVGSFAGMRELEYHLSKIEKMNAVTE